MGPRVHTFSIVFALAISAAIAFLISDTWTERVVAFVIVIASQGVIAAITIGRIRGHRRRAKAALGGAFDPDAFDMMLRRYNFTQGSLACVVDQWITARKST